MKWIALSVVAIIALVVIVSPKVESTNERTITRDEFGHAWPFTVAEGELSCERGAVTIEARGTTYAVNGTAGSRGFARIDPI